MKILICSIYLPYGNDGVSSSTKQLVKALEQKGVDVSIFTTDWGWNSDDILKYKSDKFHIFKSNLNNSFDFSYEMIKQLYKTGINYDIVHLNSIYSASTIFGARSSKKNNLPYVVAPQGNFIPSLLNENKGIRSVWKKRIFFELFSRKALQNANKVICNSELEMESLRSRIKTDNLTFISNGIDCSAFAEAFDAKIIEDKLGIKEGTPIFLFLGRLAEEKAIPFLLDVWDCFVRKMPDAVLVICGESDRGSHSTLGKKIKSMTRPETVIMPGPVTGKLKHALLQHSQCLLLPSYFESFGCVVLEALSSGIPVIASKGTPWSVLEKERLGRWLPWDAQAWAEAIYEIANNETFHSDSFSTYGKKWVNDNFSWQKLSDKYVKLYEDILKQHKK
jgi:glycosyltransferase involved in cell wall biosynthesis